MIRGVLFDLDNTLVTIDVDAFVDAYTTAMARALLPADPERGLAVMTAATYRLFTAPSAPAKNRDRLLVALAAELAMPQEDLWRRIEAASGTIVPGLRRLASPIGGAPAVVREARSRGLRVVIATTPIYPRSVIVERMAWAGVTPGEVDIIACLEACGSTKPHGDYFRELAAAVGLGPEECLMVGDDADQDLPARSTGMAVHLVGIDGARHVGEGVRAGAVTRLFQIWQDRLESAAS